MELKDMFAAHVAAALAARGDRPHEVASRAYDIAEALLEERERRLVSAERAEEGFIAYDFAREEASLAHSGLLDEPAPYTETEKDELPASWLERDEDPRWSVEPKWAEDRGPVSPRADRPGLARTQP